MLKTYKGFLWNRWFFWLFWLLLSTATAAGAEPPSSAKKTASAAALTHILFVGNSYLYYNDSLHGHVRRIAHELQPQLKGQLSYKSATIGGAKLEHHNLPWLLNHHNLGLDKPFAAVILQGASHETLSEKGRKRYKSVVADYAKHVRASGAQPYLYMTPAYAASHRRAKTGQTQVIAQATAEAAAAAEVPMIPVGLAFAEAYKRRPEIRLHKHFDASHPTLAGTYLAACVTYLSLYGGNLGPLTYTYFGEISPEMAAFLAKVAQDTVAQAVP
ncbi:MAG: hypothetical protein KTR17_12975 [Cellvibrionaceae bacterium]|nr:hypothetical protein [Cellvibrionaceae bacterium]